MGFPGNWSGESSRYLRRICAGSVRAAQRDPGDWVHPVPGFLYAEVSYDDTTAYWEIHKYLGRATPMMRNDPAEAAETLALSCSEEIFGGYCPDPYGAVEQILGVGMSMYDY